MSSEILGGAENLLKGNLGGAWDVKHGYADAYTDLGVGRKFGGASVAYSLRDIGAMNGPVVRVRRSPHDTSTGLDDEENFSANQISDGALEDWVNGKLEHTLPADVATSAGAYSLRKVRAGYGIPTTVVNGTENFPATIPTSSSPADIGNGFTIFKFGDGVRDSADATHSGGTITVTATASTVGGFSGGLRIQGLDTGKQYTVSGEFRVTSLGDDGDGQAAVDISDRTVDTDEASVETTSTTFTPFFIDAGYNATDSGNFVDLQALSNNHNSGTVTSEFRNIKIIENNNSVVRIRRSSDNEEVVVGFDSDNKVSVNSPITATPDGSTSVADLNGFLNETLDDRFSTVIYPDTIASDYRQWTTLTATSNSFSATTGTVNSDNARYNYVLPSNISGRDGAITTFRISGTVDYTTSTGSGNGFFLKFTNYINGGGSHDFGSISLTGVGTIQSNKLRFNHGDSGDFSIDVTGNGTNIIRSILFSQTEVTSGTTSISFTNLKFEIIKHGATVHTWYDQAVANNAVQETGSIQPKFAENGSLLDGIKFDAAADGSSPIYLETDSKLGDSTDSFLATVIGEAQGQTALGGIITSRSAADEGFTFGLNSSEQPQVFIYSSGGNTNAAADEVIGSRKRLLSLDKDSTIVNGNVNAAPALTLTSNTMGSITEDKSFIGVGGRTDSTPSTLGLRANINELVFYNSDQASNRFLIESNINNYYNLYNDEYEWDDTTNTEWQNSVTNGSTTFSANSKDGFTITATGENVCNFKFAHQSPSSATNNFYRVSFNANDPNGLFDTAQLRQSATGSGATAQNIKNGFNTFKLKAPSNGNFMSINIDAGGSSKTATLSDFRISRISRDGLVQAWFDQSGNGNTASKSVAANQPHIVVEGGQVRLENRTPAMGFDRNPSFSQLTITSALQDEPYTFFATTVHNGAFYFRVFADSATNSAPTLLLNSASGGSLSYSPSDSDASGALSTSAVLSDNIVSGFSGVNGGADGIVRINGTNLKTDISRTEDADSIKHIGRFPNTSTTFTCIESLVIYESDLSSDFDIIEKELAQPINIL